MKSVFLKQFFVSRGVSIVNDTESVGWMASQEAISEKYVYVYEEVLFEKIWSTAPGVYKGIDLKKHQVC